MLTHAMTMEMQPCVSVREGAVMQYASHHLIFQPQRENILNLIRTTDIAAFDGFGKYIPDSSVGGNSDYLFYMYVYKIV